MAEEDIKKIIKEVNRHQNILYEKFHGEVKVIAEQYTDIKNTLDEHTEILDSHTEMIGSMKTDIKIIKDNLDEHTRILGEHTRMLGEHTEMIGSMKTDIEIIKTNIEFIKNSLKRKVDLEEFETLEKRVRLLESRIKV